MADGARCAAGAVVNGGVGIYRIHCSLSHLLLTGQFGLFVEAVSVPS
ncbi:hypothetical protein OKW32_003578 [Paraburkholderia youngii]